MGLSKLFKTGDYKFDVVLKGVVTEEEVGEENQFLEELDL